MKNKLALGLSLFLTISLVGCAIPQEQPRSNEPIVFGTSQCCNVLDPANTYSTIDYLYLHQIYPALFNSTPDSNEIVPDIAEQGEFVAPDVYRITVKRNLVFSNGNSLTASDAVFSLNRQMTIASVNGPSTLLRNIESVTLVDDYTLEVKTNVQYDATIRNVLASAAGLIVDEQVFAADRVMENSEIVSANSYGGAYSLAAFEAGALMALEPNPNYSGAWGQPRNSGVIIKSYQDNSNLIADFNSGTVDVFTAWRDTLDPSVAELMEGANANFFESKTIEAVYLYLNYDGLPFGKNTANPDSSKSLKIRKAIETLLVREDLDQRAYFGRYEPMYATLPNDVTYSLANQLDTSSKTAFDRTAEATALLEDLGIPTPIEIGLITSSGRWGDLGLRLATNIETQLEINGLFDVKIEDLVWEEVRERRRSATFDTMLFKWAIDFSDPDNYIAPLVADGGFLTSSGYNNNVLQQLLSEQLSVTSNTQRQELLRQVQMILANDLPYIPLLSGGPVVIANKKVVGAESFMNREFKLLFAFLSK